MKTDEMIDNLSNELKTARRHFYGTSLLLWGTETAVILTVLFHLLPLRHDLSLTFRSVSFQFEAVLLLALFAVSTLISYRSVVPGLLGRTEQWIGLALIALFVLFVLSRFSASTFLSELHLEMDFYRGRCGPIIITLAGLQTAVGILIARRAAPTDLVRTGAWLGVSAGAMSLLAIQLICPRENFLHLLVWHALPAAFVVAAGSLLGRRFLRW